MRPAKRKGPATSSQRLNNSQALISTRNACLSAIEYRVVSGMIMPPDCKLAGPLDSGCGVCYPWNAFPMDLSGDSGVPKPKRVLQHF